MKKTKKLAMKSIGLGVLAALSLVACKPSSTKLSGSNPGSSSEVKGPSETGGGNVTKYNLGAEFAAQEVQKAYNRADRLINLYEAFSSDESGIETSKVEDVDNTELKELVKSLELAKSIGKRIGFGENLRAVYKRLKPPKVLVNDYCTDKFGNTVEGSSVDPDQICFSGLAISENSDVSQMNIATASIVMHELGHMVGLNEEECRSLEAVMLFFIPSQREIFNYDAGANELLSFKGEANSAISHLRAIVEQDKHRMPDSKLYVEKIVSNNLVLRTKSINSIYNRADTPDLVNEWNGYLLKSGVDEAAVAKGLSSDVIKYVVNGDLSYQLHSMKLLRSMLDEKVRMADLDLERAKSEIHSIASAYFSWLSNERQMSKVKSLINGESFLLSARQLEEASVSAAIYYLIFEIYVNKVFQVRNGKSDIETKRSELLAREEFSFCEYDRADRDVDFQGFEEYCKKSDIILRGAKGDLEKNMNYNILVMQKLWDRVYEEAADSVKKTLVADCLISAEGCMQEEIDSL